MYVQYGMHICSRAYANNVKCMCTRVAGHIVDCSGFIGGIYAYGKVSCGCKLIDIWFFLCSLRAY